MRNVVTGRGSEFGDAVAGHPESDVVPMDGIEDSLVVAPTVLSDVTNDMSAACFEQFGPIAPVIPFPTVDEAVVIHNDTEYGLSGAVHATDAGTGHSSSDNRRV